MELSFFINLIIDITIFLIFLVIFIYLLSKHKKNHINIKKFAIPISLFLLTFLSIAGNILTKNTMHFDNLVEYVIQKIGYFLLCILALFLTNGILKKYNNNRKHISCEKKYINESYIFIIIIVILLFIIIGLSIYINILIRDISNANKIKNGLIQDYLELELSIPDKSLYDAIMNDSIDEFYLTIEKQSLYNAIIDNKVDEYYLNK